MEKEIFVSGVVISIGSGVVRLQGFLMAFVGEIFRICVLGDVFGLVINLYRDLYSKVLISALLLNSDARVTNGAKAIGMKRLASIIVGDFALGSILDPLGNLTLAGGAGKITNLQFRWLIESPAPSIIDRQSVCEPLQTGIIAIDAMIPVGRGQRELIIGDRQTGKTSIGVDTIINQKYEKVLCVYLPIGQKASAILEVFMAFVRRDAVFFLTMLVASAASSAVLQYLVPYTGCAMAEFFMYVREIPVFIFFDDVSKHAAAFREISLLLRRPPGREAYPGEIFFVHSRLLERSAKLSDQLGGGSITAFPVIETLAGDVSAYVPTNVISITDGQIFLSQDLFNSGIKPAIDVGISVTRVGSAAQWDGMKVVAGSYKLELAQYVELQSFSQFAADLGEESKKQLARGAVKVEILKQFVGNPMNLMRQVGLLSLANQGVAEQVDVADVQKFIKMYLDLPTWLMLFVPARLVGLALVDVIRNN